MEPARAPVHGLRWSAICPRARRSRKDCVNNAAIAARRRARTGDGPATQRQQPTTPGPTDLPAAQAHVSWRYYVKRRAPSPTARTTKRSTCTPSHQSRKTPGIWNPLADFTDVKQDGQLGNIQSARPLLQPCANRHVRPARGLLGRSPTGDVSEHPPSRDRRSQALRDRADQRDHAQPVLEQHGDLPLLG